MTTQADRIAKHNAGEHREKPDRLCSLCWSSDDSGIPSPAATARQELERRWVEADKAFQNHRMTCGICRYNVRRMTRLCGDGRVLFDEAERLLAAVNPSRPAQPERRI